MVIKTLLMRCLQMVQMLMQKTSNCLFDIKDMEALLLFGLLTLAVKKLSMR